MNCKQYQEKITETLAAGISILPDIAAHQNSCATCGAFYAAQQSLFESIDTGLRSLVNQPVPSSLLPFVRSRLNENPASGSASIPGWSVAVVAAVALLAVSIGFSLRRHTRPGVNSAENRATVSRGINKPQLTAQAHNELPKKDSPRTTERRVATVSPPTPEPEVIVLAEEREAFAEFVAEVPEEPSVALALTQPSPESADEPLEIALLRIDGLEVKPLESSATKD